MTSSLQNRANAVNGAFAMAMIGGFLMLILPLIPIQYNGPACLQGSACSMIPAWVSVWLFVVGVVLVGSGVGALVTALMIKIARVQSYGLLGWVLILMAAIYLLGLMISAVLSVMSNIGPFLEYFGIPLSFGPLLVLTSGLLLVKKHTM